MPQLVLPKTALKDVKLLLGLDAEKLRGLEEFFATKASLAPRRPEHLKDLSKRLGLDIPTVETALIVCQFLLSVAGEGANPEEMVGDLKDFIAQYVPAEKELLESIDKKQQALISLLTPKRERIVAKKVELLAHGPHPTVDSFRTICDLRPVFERVDGKETIVGYVPTILLEAKLSDLGGEESTVLMYMTTDMLESLKKVIARTEEKLNAVRDTFKNDLLHD